MKPIEHLNKIAEEYGARLQLISDLFTIEWFDAASDWDLEENEQKYIKKPYSSIMAVYVPLAEPASYPLPSVHTIQNTRYYQLENGLYVSPHTFKILNQPLPSFGKDTFKVIPDIDPIQILSQYAHTKK